MYLYMMYTYHTLLFGERVVGTSTNCPKINGPVKTRQKEKDEIRTKVSNRMGRHR